MKKILVFCLTFFFFFNLSLSDAPVQASCRPFSEKEEVVSDFDRIELTDSVEMEEPDVEILCSKTTPTGWAAVRSTARLTNTSGTGVKNYVKNADAAQASRDFNSILPGVKVQKSPNPDGSVTLYKVSPTSGAVSMYKATSTGTTSLNWMKEKIRYNN